MRKILVAFLGLFVFLSGTASAVDVDNPPKGIFSDEWYALMLDGNKSGHMHSTMERLKVEGKHIIRSTNVMEISVGRADARIDVSFTQSSDETLDGKPLSFEHQMHLGKVPATTQGVIRDGMVTVSTTQFGLPMGTKTYPLPEGAIMAWGTYREQMKRGLKPGLKYDLSVYEPTMAPDRLTRTTMEVFKQEEIDLFGRKVTAYRTKQTAHLNSRLLGQSSVNTTTWMTDAGTAVKIQMSMPPIDMPFEVIACPRAVATSENEPTELMVQTLIRADRPIDSENAKSVTYRLITRGAEDSKLNLPETPMQKIVEQRGGIVTLKLTRLSARRAGQRPRAAKPPATMPADDLQSFLEASPDVNWKDPVVAALARKAAGDEKDPWKLAERLCDFVHDYVQTKNLNVGFATASEVARSKEGDCTEHGILLAALGRAVGIPTRIVTGIVYTDDFANRKNVFVGHLWTQFWIDGEWIDVDSAFGETDVDPTHIAMGISAAGDTGMADLVASGWLNLSKMRLKVLSVEK